MDIRADVNNKFIRRFLYIAIGCFLFMLWGLYDGLYTSPKKLKAAKAYQELFEQREEGEITESERAENWKVMATEQGWGLDRPKRPEEAQNYVYFQWFVFGLGLILGLFFLIKYLRLLNSWVQADDKGVSSSWGESLQFDRIQQINKRKWEKKGIARVAFQDESGAAKTMVFDDFKFDREMMGMIISLAEKNLTDDQIIGGLRESAKVDMPLESSEPTG